MSQDENINLNNGQKECESRILNLESILMKVENVLDVSKYRNKLEQIKDEMNSRINSSNRMISSYNIGDTDTISYDLYIQEIDNLKKKIDEEILPFYELYLLSSKIERQISNIIEDGVDEIIKNTKELIDTLNSISNYNVRDVGYLIDRAYRIIYYVIIHEEIFNRSDILTYINDLNIPSNKENIGKLLLADIIDLNERDVSDDEFQNIIIDENLRNINAEGLGYDYLNSDFIRKISRKVIGKKHMEYEDRKNRVVSEISSKINTFTRKNDSLLTSFNKSNEKIKNLYINKSLLFAKALSIVLVPVITFSLGRMIGKNASNKITEYKTITRTVDLNTKNIVGDIEYVYDENETTYVATVMKCSPWRSNPSGMGYIRTVTAYEYIDNNEGIHTDIEYLEQNLIEKYIYIESKESLDREDSTTETTILLTETYQDKTDSRKSTKYIIPFSIVGAGVGIAIDVALVLLGIYDFQRVKEMFDDLDYEIRNSKLNNQEIRDRLNKMMEDGKRLQDEYNDVVKRYGEFKIENVTTVEETPSKKENVKTRIKKKL